MAAVKEIRGRIRSIKNTAKITKAMQLVAAAKMRRAQEGATAGKPYSDLMDKVLRSLVVSIDPTLHPLLVGNGSEKALVVAIASDRGLAGALTSNLIKKLLEFPPESEFVSLGTKAKNFFAKTRRNIIADFPLPEHSSLPRGLLIRDLSSDVTDLLKFDQIHSLPSSAFPDRKLRAIVSATIFRLVGSLHPLQQ